jgi:hypothetical protein
VDITAKTIPGADLIRFFTTTKKSAAPRLSFEFGVWERIFCFSIGTAQLDDDIEQRGTIR